MHHKTCQKWKGYFRWLAKQDFVISQSNARKYYSELYITTNELDLNNDYFYGLTVKWLIDLMEEVKTPIDQRIKIIFLLRLPVKDRRLRMKFEKEGDLEFDDKNRIKKYLSRDGKVKLEMTGDKVEGDEEQKGKDEEVGETEQLEEKEVNFDSSDDSSDHMKPERPLHIPKFCRPGGMKKKPRRDPLTQGEKNQIDKCVAHKPHIGRLAQMLHRSEATIRKYVADPTAPVRKKRAVAAYLTDKDKLRIVEMTKKSVFGALKIKNELKLAASISTVYKFIKSVLGGQNDNEDDKEKEIMPKPKKRGLPINDDVELSDQPSKRARGFRSRKMEIQHERTPDHATVSSSSGSEVARNDNEAQEASGMQNEVDPGQEQDVEHMKELGVMEPNFEFDNSESYHGPEQNEPCDELTNYQGPRDALDDHNEQQAISDVQNVQAEFQESPVFTHYQAQPREQVASVEAHCGEDESIYLINASRYAQDLGISPSKECQDIRFDGCDDLYGSIEEAPEDTEVTAEQDRNVPVEDELVQNNSHYEVRAPGLISVTKRDCDLDGNVCQTSGPIYAQDSYEDFDSEYGYIGYFEEAPEDTEVTAEQDHNVPVEEEQEDSVINESEQVDDESNAVQVVKRVSFEDLVDQEEEEEQKNKKDKDKDSEIIENKTDDDKRWEPEVIYYNDPPLHYVFILRLDSAVALYDGDELAAVLEEIHEFENKYWRKKSEIVDTEFIVDVFYQKMSKALKQSEANENFFHAEEFITDIELQFLKYEDDNLRTRSLEAVKDLMKIAREIISITPLVAALRDIIQELEYGITLSD